MKKLAIYCDSLSRGGAERVTICLAKYMIDAGISCDIITTRYGKEEYELPIGVTRYCADSRSIKVLRKLFKKSGADTLLIMGVPICVFGIPASRRLNMKVVVSERNAPSMFAGRKSTKVLSRFLMKFADGFVFQTNDAKNFYAKVLNNRGTVIPNPIILDGFPEVYRGKRNSCIVTAGRLVGQKNHELLIKAFSKIANKYPDVNLIIYGEGNLRESLVALVKELDLWGRVNLPGNKENLPDLIKSSMLFVLPSHFEGMPNALIEAMALGLPCIATDCPCGGPRELIQNGKNGILVPVDDESALVDAMDNLISNELLRNKLGDKASEVRKSLNVSTIGATWKNFLTNIKPSI